MLSVKTDFSRHSEGTQSPYQRPKKRISRFILLVLLASPYLLLLMLSCGSGWSYPNLGPDKLDLNLWSTSLLAREDLLRAAGVSFLMAFSVATLSTTTGMLLARRIQIYERVAVFIIYLPFLCSPVIIGMCLLDLFIRIDLASTIFGTFLIQSVFAIAFASILFLELEPPELRRLENLIRSLGGGYRSCWRHALWPKLWKIIIICWCQTFLFSWLDYGFVSTVGGGVVPSLTLKAIAYIRESSINHAAMASILLMMPPFIFAVTVTTLFRHRMRWDCK